MNIHEIEMYSKATNHVEQWLVEHLRSRSDLEHLTSEDVRIITKDRLDTLVTDLTNSFVSRRLLRKARS